MTEKIYNPTSLGNTVHASQTSGNSLESKVDKLVLIITDKELLGIKLKDKVYEKYTKIILAETGEQGLKLSQTEKPDLILLDTEFNGMNDYEFYDELLLQKYVPIVHIIGIMHKCEINERMKKVNKPNKKILGYSQRQIDDSLLAIMDDYFSKKQ